MEQIWFLAGGLLLGCLHSLEADHIVTVSNLILNKNSLKKSLRLALQWALGHSFTLLVLSVGTGIFSELRIHGSDEYFSRANGGGHHDLYWHGCFYSGVETRLKIEEFWS